MAELTPYDSVHTEDTRWTLKMRPTLIIVHIPEKEESHREGRFGDRSTRLKGAGGKGAQCASKRGSSVTQKVQDVAFTGYMVRSWA